MIRSASISALRERVINNISIDTGHMEILKKVPGIGMYLQNDLQISELHFNRRFSARIPSRDDWETDDSLLHPKGLNWYTDGSKTDLGVGAGIWGPNCKIAVSMGKWPTVFQSEIYAILTTRNPEEEH